jgi:hypothetical protein
MAPSPPRPFPPKPEPFRVKAFSSREPDAASLENALIPAIEKKPERLTPLGFLVIPKR